jgi:hypothetical protein
MTPIPFGAGRDMIQSGFERALILEDDVQPTKAIQHLNFSTVLEGKLPKVRTMACDSRTPQNPLGP